MTYIGYYYFVNAFGIYNPKPKLQPLDSQSQQLPASLSLSQPLSVSLSLSQSLSVSPSAQEYYRQARIHIYYIA